MCLTKFEPPETMLTLAADVVLLSCKGFLLVSRVLPPLLEVYPALLLLWKLPECNPLPPTPSCIKFDVPATPRPLIAELPEIVGWRFSMAH